MNIPPTNIPPMISSLSSPAVRDGSRGAARRSWNLVGLSTLTAYSTALGWFAQQAAYPLFGKVGAGEFAAFHEFYNHAILWPVVVPAFIGFASAAIFPWTRPRHIPLAPALVVAASGLTCLASTVGWAIPMHARLDDEGFARATLDTLLAANLVRTVALTAGTLTLGWCVRRMSR